MRRLRVLGPLEVDGTGQALGPRDRVVVSALAVRPGERVDAEVLAEALWGEHPPVSSAKVVQGCVSRLRHALGAETIETVDGGYRLRTDHLDLDRQDFEHLVDRAREHLANRTPHRAIPLLTEALTLWRGPAFGTLEEWMPGRLEAVRLGQLRLAAEEDLLQARLDAGDHQGVAADATVLTGQQPFRERRWALLALAQYRCGRQADALASIRAARRALGQELGLDPGSELVALEARILAQDASLAADHEARLADGACPWKGLAAYDDRDAETFFGRDPDVAACLARLAESRMLVVSGPSGSGKSSLVRAGLVPALKAEGWRVELMTPGADGGQAMAAARQLSAGDPLIIVDQFEETFTLRDAAFARPWLGELARYARTTAPVVLVVRGDHLAELGADPDLARLAERGLHLVAPLEATALREVVEGPAKVSGLRIEPGLVDLLVRDAEGQPGALPLLSHALTETWVRREAGLLTVDGYLAAGGIRDAVAASAERLYDDLTPAEQTQVRWLMLRLVSLSDSGEPFRTRLPASVAAGLDAVRRQLLDLLVRARLVTSHAGGYEVAHEALVRAWPRLRGWLDEDRTGQQIRRHLTMAAAGWEALGRSETELYRGARLAAALDWLDGDEPLDDSEREFMEASRAVSEQEVRRLAAQTRRQRTQNRRLRGLVAAALALVVVATIAGSVALDRSRQASAGRTAATDAAQQAAHESLVARSLALRSSDRVVAALLAIQAWRGKPDEYAESAMLGSLTAAPTLLGYGAISGFGWFADTFSVAAVPHAKRVLVAAGNSLAWYDPRTQQLSTTFARHGAASGATSVLRVSADGSRAVQLFPDGLLTGCTSDCSVLVVYDLGDRRVLTEPLPVGFPASDVAISADGGVVAAVGSGRGTRGDAATWDASTGRPLARARLGGTSVALGTGDRMYVGTPGGPILEVSSATLQVRRSVPAEPGSSDIRIIATGARLLAAGTTGEVAVDLPGDEVTWSSGDAHRGASHGCVTLAVSVTLSRVYCGTTDGRVEERDALSGDTTGRVLDAQFGAPGDLVVESDSGRGTVLFELSGIPPAYAEWRLDGPGVGGRLLAPNAVSAGGYDPSGQLLLVTRRGRSEVVDGSGAATLLLPVGGPATWLSSSVVAVLGRRPSVVELKTGRVVPLQLRDVVDVFPGTGDRAWAVSQQGDVTKVRGFSLRSGLRDGPAMPPIEHSDSPEGAAYGSRVLVASRDVRYSASSFWWGVSEFDARTGRPVGDMGGNSSKVAFAPDGRVLGGDAAGNVDVFSGQGMNAEASFPRVRAAVSSVQVSRDGARVLVTAQDQTVHLFDWDTRERLGDPITTSAPVGVVGGWLRPDGDELVTNTRDGVVAWDLRPETMVDHLCALAGRNPTYAEWSTYIGDATPYVELCPGYLTALDQVDQS